MNETDPVMRAARNGFAVLMVALLGSWAYGFRTDGGPTQRLFDLLLLGALVYWVSQLYYSRQSQDGNGADSHD
ncbi:hypothetical protein SAMN05216226_10393 [Halovenus aranensis]|jgi:hypothetical protein|uniref:Uncharacterized protein n=1 Tax=Halovenus aranensis TaxID=890420 RepID=A0A1G8TL86_9EURY|nr:hypothetical protein [Halovenus aranensis]SDJ41430.1 hypothetical protein SAMN05216226_10393 [Halovenus aranensis]